MSLFYRNCREVTRLVLERERGNWAPRRLTAIAGGSTRAA